MIRCKIYLPINPLPFCTWHAFIVSLGVFNKVGHAFCFHCYRVEGLDIGCFAQSTSAARMLLD